MFTDTADEAQALIFPGITMETGRIRDGVVEHAEVMQVPDAFFEATQNSVIEQLKMARKAALRDYPHLAANSVVDRLVHDSVVLLDDAQYVRALVELEIKRGIEHLFEDARGRFATRLPITLRSLIPLITRRSGNK